jgi:hypothetical protein
MKNRKDPFNKNKFKTVLLSALLILNVFSFSGEAGNAQTKQQQATKIEWLSSPTTYVKQVLSYRKALLFYSCKFSIHSAPGDYKNILLIYNRRVNTQEIFLSKRFFSFRPALAFFQAKAHPQNAEEGLFYSI